MLAVMNCKDPVPAPESLNEQPELVTVFCGGDKTV